MMIDGDNRTFKERHQDDLGWLAELEREAQNVGDGGTMRLTFEHVMKLIAWIRGWEFPQKVGGYKNWPTKEQYEKALERLRDGMSQLQPNAHCCAICGDSGHQAFECVRHNPLLKAMLFDRLVAASEDLHDLLHEILPR